MQLKKLQENFISATLKGENEKLIPEMLDAGIDKKALIAIYNNNAYSFLSNALKLTFPATCELIGEDKFIKLAYKFIKEHPSTSGNLEEYGEGFYKILSGEEQDLAKFEWLYHQSTNADKDEVFELSKFAEVSPEQYETLRFSTQNSFNIFSSKFPILKTWQENTKQPVTAEEGETKIIIIRPRLEVEIYKLGDDEFAFVKELFEGKDLLAAYMEAEKFNPNFDMGAALSKNLRRNIFKNYYL